MPTKVLGRATYKAIRSGGSTRLIAHGQTPNLNDKVDIEPLPFLIFPPWYGFYFIHQDIQLPAVKPFVYEEEIFVPASANSVQVQDAVGRHTVPIETIAPPHVPTEPAPTTPGFCVFALVAGGGPLLIAPCASILPAIYHRVFGPATYGECKDYVKKHGGA